MPDKNMTNMDRKALDRQAANTARSEGMAVAKLTNTIASLDRTIQGMNDGNTSPKDKKGPGTDPLKQLTGIFSQGITEQTKLLQQIQKDQSDHYKTAEKLYKEESDKAEKRHKEDLKKAEDLHKESLKDSDDKHKEDLETVVQAQKESLNKQNINAQKQNTLLKSLITGMNTFSKDVIASTVKKPNTSQKQDNSETKKTNSILESIASKSNDKESSKTNVLLKSLINSVQAASVTGDARKEAEKTARERNSQLLKALAGISDSFSKGSKTTTKKKDGDNIAKMPGGKDFNKQFEKKMKGGGLIGGLMTGLVTGNWIPFAVALTGTILKLAPFLIAGAILFKKIWSKWGDDIKETMGKMFDKAKTFMFDKAIGFSHLMVNLVYRSGVRFVKGLVSAVPFLSKGLKMLKGAVVEQIVKFTTSIGRSLVEKIGKTGAGQAVKAGVKGAATRAAETTVGRKVAAHVGAGIAEKELGKGAAKILGKEVLEEAGQAAVKAGVKSTAKTVGKSVIGKVAEMALSDVGLGFLISIPFAIGRFRKGDVKGGLLELATALPFGVGNVISIYLMFRDMKDAFTGGGGAVADDVQSTGDDVQKMGDKIKGFFVNIGGWIAAPFKWLKGVWDDFIVFGKQVMPSIIGSLKKAGSSLVAGFKQIGKNLAAPFIWYGKMWKKYTVGVIGIVKKVSGKITEGIKSAVGFIKNVFDRFIDINKKIFSKVVDGVKGAKDKLIGGLKKVGGWIAAPFKWYIGMYKKIFSKTIELVKKAKDKFIGGLKKVAGWISAPFKWYIGMYKKVILKTIDLVGKAKDRMLGGLKKVVSYVIAPFKWFAGMYKKVFLSVLGFVKDNKDKVINVFKKIGSWIAAPFKWYAKMWGKTFSFISKMVIGAKDKFIKVFKNVVGWITKPIKTASGFITDVFGKVTDAVTATNDKIRSILINIGNVLMSPFKLFADMWSKVMDFGKGAVSKVKGAWGWFTGKLGFGGGEEDAMNTNSIGSSNMSSPNSFKAPELDTPEATGNNLGDVPKLGVNMGSYNGYQGNSTYDSTTDTGYNGYLGGNVLTGSTNRHDNEDEDDEEDAPVADVNKKHWWNKAGDFLTTVGKTVQEDSAEDAAKGGFWNTVGNAISFTGGVLAEGVGHLLGGGKEEEAAVAQVAENKTEDVPLEDPASTAGPQAQGESGGVPKSNPFSIMYAWTQMQGGALGSLGRIAKNMAIFAKHGAAKGGGSGGGGYGGHGALSSDREEILKNIKEVGPVGIKNPLNYYSDELMREKVAMGPVSINPKYEGQNFASPENNGVSSFPKALMLTQSNPVDVSGVDPDLWKNFEGMVSDYYLATGDRVQLNSAYRSIGYAKHLYKTMKPGFAAFPGASTHTGGWAFDIQSSDANAMRDTNSTTSGGGKIMDKWGFWQPGLNWKHREEWHIEPHRRLFNRNRFIDAISDDTRRRYGTNRDENWDDLIDDKEKDTVNAQKMDEFLDDKSQKDEVANLPRGTRFHLLNMAKKYYDQTGEKLRIYSAARSTETQKKLWEKYKGTPNEKYVSPPGYSAHERGMAIDIDKEQVAKIDGGLLQQYGFWRPDIEGEPWHIEDNSTKAVRNEEDKLRAFGRIENKGGPTSQYRADPVETSHNFFTGNDKVKDKKSRKSKTQQGEHGSLDAMGQVGYNVGDVAMNEDEDIRFARTEQQDFTTGVSDVSNAESVAESNSLSKQRIAPVKVVNKIELGDSTISKIAKSLSNGQSGVIQTPRNKGSKPSIPFNMRG